MKKVTRLLASALLLVVAFAAMACGSKPSGTYSVFEVGYKMGEVEVSIKADELKDNKDIPQETKSMMEAFLNMKFEFDGNQISVKVLFVTMKTSFKMDGEKIITLDKDGNESNFFETISGFGDLGDIGNIGDIGDLEDVMPQISMIYKNRQVIMQIVQGETEMFVTFKKQ